MTDGILIGLFLRVGEKVHLRTTLLFGRRWYP